MCDNTTFAQIRKRGEAIKEDIIAWRRIFHAMPELRMDTPKTEAQIVKILQEIGVDDIRAGVGGHGVCAVIRGEQPGQCLGIRADCDGLPVQEETGLPFASQNGNMHACGHDAHTAMALGAAKLLSENRHLLKGCVKFIFQPYEEGGCGANLMIADGALQDPSPHAVIALHNHCTPDEDYRLGDVLVTPKAITANIYSYEATFRGTTSHVCLAESARNAVYMACDAVAKIAVLPKGDDESVNAVTMVHGGVRNNIIPETCTVTGSIRAFDRSVHAALRKAVHTILEESARKFGGEVEVRVAVDTPGTEIDGDVYARFCAITNALYPERGVVMLKERECIGEDFAQYANRVPGLYFKLHTQPKNTCYPLHHPRFDVDEDTLHKGSVLFAGFALGWQDAEV